MNDQNESERRFFDRKNERSSSWLDQEFNERRAFARRRRRRRRRRCRRRRRHATRRAQNQSRAYMLKMSTQRRKEKN